jgi:hypothetical protein
MLLATGSIELRLRGSSYIPFCQVQPGGRDGLRPAEEAVEFQRQLIGT